MRKTVPPPDPNEDIEIARIAIRLYERDLERDADARSLQDALDEMKIPHRYIRDARKQFEQDRLIKAGYVKKKPKSWLYALIAFVVVGVILWTVLLWSWLAPARPFQVGFADPYSHWDLDTNNGSVANFTASNSNVGRITVDHFASNKNPKQNRALGPLTYWVTLATIQQHFDFYRLRTATFSARGEGITAFRFATKANGVINWISPKMTVSQNWQTYNVDLRSAESTGDVTLGTDAEDSQGFAIQLSSATNDESERGYLEISPIRIH